jgi:rod shape-determining protein MreC
MARRDEPRSGTKVLALLVLAALALITLDARGHDGSPVDPARTAVGTVVGPFESAANGAVRPFRSVAKSLHSNSSLRHDVASLQSQNSDLRSQLATTSVDRNRLAEYDGLVRTAKDTGYALVPSHVVGIGPAQSFSRTVTIDAGTSSGVHPDSTVVSRDGLVGRVIRTTRSTATVLLIVDADSVVGGRLGSTMKIGFIRGRGVAGTKGRLDLDLVDSSASPARNDVVVSWGSGKGGPYVAGIPIGRVASVYSSPRELSKQAVIDPFVDFSALDLVGVVVPRDTKGDRNVIRADGTIR